MGWAADGEAGRRCASVTGTSFTSIGRDDFPCGGPSVGTCSITTPRSCGSYGAPMVLGRSLAARTIGGRSGTLEPFSCSRRRSPSWLPPGPADTPRDGTAPVRTLRYAHASRSQRVTILRRADYGSEGWGFESLRARNIKGVCPAETRARRLSRSVHCGPVVLLRCSSVSEPPSPGVCGCVRATPISPDHEPGWLHRVSPLRPGRAAVGRRFRA